MSTQLKFPKVIAALDAASKQHCLRLDDESARRVFNVTLTGWQQGEPTQRQWAEYAASALNFHPLFAEYFQLSERLDLERMGRMDTDQLKLVDQLQRRKNLLTVELNKIRGG